MTIGQEVLESLYAVHSCKDFEFFFEDLAVLCLSHDTWHFNRLVESLSDLIRIDWRPFLGHLIGLEHNRGKVAKSHIFLHQLMEVRQFVPVAEFL